MNPESYGHQSVLHVTLKSSRRAGSILEDELLERPAMRKNPPATNAGGQKKIARCLGS